MNRNQPPKKYNVQDMVQTPIGLRKLLDIIPIKYGEQTVDWLYIFGDHYDEKFTREELEQ
jgi:hypothetical protein